MRLRPFRFLSLALVFAFGLAGLATVAFAFENSLTADAIRNAYFIATGSPAKRTDFFSTYVHHLTAPDVGPNISSVELETPFANVVQQISDHSLNMRAPDAVQDFYGKPVAFQVRVVVDFTPTYPAPATTAMQLGDFWNDFEIHLTQGSEISPIGVHGTPILSDLTMSGYIGAVVVADYNPAEIQSGPATVVVTGPDGARAETSFDLSDLR
ncbi:MAG TPA: hypothetical protein VMB47_12530 [Candidatus Aquilonibacter sp.]|nr:hypothetical protein [Candidatus Aquilonibacter sp.]